jgi:hypothetical protein
MMCLGWKEPKGCAVQVTNPTACPDLTWFWVGLGVVAVGFLAKGGKKGGGGRQGQTGSTGTAAA